MSDITISAPITLPAAVTITAPITIGYQGATGATGATGADGPDTLAELSDVTTYDLPTANTPLAEALAAKAASSSLSYVALSGSYDDLIDVPAPSPGVSEVADLTDATTFDFPTLNTPVSNALAAKANSADLGTIATFEGDQNLRTTDPATFAGGIFNGSVGIGTGTPESFLNIVNPATSGNNGSLVIEHTGSNFGAGLKVKGGLNPQIRLESGAINTKFQISGGVATFGTESNNKFSVITNNTAKLTVDSSGNVGIGTTTPAEKLDVVGNIKASGTVTAASLTTTGNCNIKGLGVGVGTPNVTDGSFRYFYSGTNFCVFIKDFRFCLSSSTAFGFGPSAIGSTTPDTALSRISAGIMGLGTGTAGSTAGTLSLANLTASGNVGIGITTPTEKLDVSGYIKASTGFRMGNYTIVSEGGNETILSNTAFYGFLFKTNNATRMKITNAGNVGIGTTTPAEKLDVVGNIKASGTVTAGEFKGVTDTIIDADGIVSIRKGGSERIKVSGTIISFNATLAPVSSSRTLGTVGLPWSEVHVVDIKASGTVKRGSQTVAVATASSSASAVAAGAGTDTYISDESGGATLAISDGTVWRRVSDRAAIS